MVRMLTGVYKVKRKLFCFVLILVIIIVTVGCKMVSNGKNIQKTKLPNSINKKIFLGGWSVQEPWGRWSSNDDSEILLPKKQDIPNGYLFISTHSYHVSRNVIIFVNGKKLTSLQITPEIVTYLIWLPNLENDKNYIVVDFKTLEPLESPKEIDKTNDSRFLGFGIDAIEFIAALNENSLQACYKK